MRVSFLAAALVAGLMSGPALAEVVLKEDVNYKVVNVQPSAKLRVMEFFNYGCPSCYAHEATVDAWLASKSAEVEFIRVPVDFKKPGWEQYLKAFYMAEELKIAEKNHKAMFQHIYTDNKHITSDDELIAYFVGQGIAEADAKKAMNSFHVKSGMKKSANLAKKFQIGSTPTFIVNDMYATSSIEAGGQNKLGETLNALLQKK